MKQIEPPPTINAFRRAFDNGGRFYNIFSKADDHVVDAGELAKAAGTFSAGATAVLHFEFLRGFLAPAERTPALDLLDADLRERHARFRPVACKPSRFEAKVSAGTTAVVAGYPRHLENRTEFSGFIFIYAGDVLVPIPIYDQFDVYEVFDRANFSGTCTLLAVARGTRFPEGRKIVAGGVARKLHLKDKTPRPHTLYLEIQLFALR